VAERGGVDRSVEERATDPHRGETGSGRQWRATMGKKAGRKRDLSAAFNKGAAGRDGGGGGFRTAAAQKLRQSKVSARMSNPFEARDNKKVKHEVLNRKLKGSSRNVALSRGLAYEKRKRTLLGEFEQSKKANAFLDKRFGEKDNEMTEEEKVLERFKRLRGKRNLYDLSDTDGGGKRPKVELTHLGQSIGAPENQDSEMKEFERLMRENDLDNEEDAMEDRIDATELMERIKAMDTHNGTGSERKSKKEVMEEVIAKAKMFKAQRQREKEDDENERTRLDDTFKSLMQQGLFAVNPTKKEKQAEALARMMAKLEGGTDDTLRDVDKNRPEDNEEEDEYDRTVRSFLFEARAAATDRTLTPEEKAKRELASLEEKQKALERRMEGRMSDEESSDDEAPRGKKGKRKRKAKKSKDAFFDGEEEESDEEDFDEDMDSDENSDMDESDDESDDELMSRGKKSNPEALKKRKKLTIDARANIISQAKGELPFLIQVPDSHVGFVQFLNAFPEASLTEVVNRIIKTNSIHLLAENRGKLKEFTEILIDHLAWLAERKSCGTSPVVETEDIENCISSIYALVQDIPREAAMVFNDRLGRMQVALMSQVASAFGEGANGGGDYGCQTIEVVANPGDLRKKRKGGHKGARGRAIIAMEREEEAEDMKILGGGLPVSSTRCWPSPGDLVFYRAIQCVFPVTDFRHPVVSPAQLLLGQYLAQCPIRGHRDIVACLATCNILLDFCKDAKRFAPEAALALEAVLTQVFLPVDDVGNNEARLSVLAQICISGREGQALPELEWLRKSVQEGLKSKSTSKAEPRLGLDLFIYGGQEKETTSDSELGARLAGAMGKLCVLFAETVKESASGDVVLKGLATALEKGQKRSKVVRNALGHVNSTIEELEAAREPMRLLKTGAKAIMTIDPLFNERYTWTKDGHDPDKVRAEVKKLRRTAIRERKGVARELRKDAQFLSEQRQKEKQQTVDELRRERQRNFDLLTQNAGSLDKAVRESGARGGGTSRADMRGRRKK